jgi:hypothetical protein
LRPVNVCAMLFSHLVEPPGPGRLSGRPQSIATIRTGVDPESINYNRRQAVYEAIPGHSEITVLCRAAFRPALSPQAWSRTEHACHARSRGRFAPRATFLK